MRIRSDGLIAFSLAALLSACASRGTIKDPLAEPPAEPVTLEVNNNNWRDVVIYVVAGGQRFRVMEVVATNTATIVLQPHLLGHAGEIRLQAYLLGGNRRSRLTSERIFASPGSMISWTLESDLRRANVAVR